MLCKNPFVEREGDPPSLHRGEKLRCWSRSRRGVVARGPAMCLPWGVLAGNTGAELGLSAHPRLWLAPKRSNFDKRVVARLARVVLCTPLPPWAQLEALSSRCIAAIRGAAENRKATVGDC